MEILQKLLGECVYKMWLYKSFWQRFMSKACMPQYLFYLFLLVILENKNDNIQKWVLLEDIIIHWHIKSWNLMHWSFWAWSTWQTDGPSRLNTGCSLVYEIIRTILSNSREIHVSYRQTDISNYRIALPLKKITIPFRLSTSLNVPTASWSVLTACSPGPASLLALWSKSGRNNGYRIYVDIKTG